MDPLETALTAQSNAVTFSIGYRLAAMDGSLLSFFDEASRTAAGFRHERGARGLNMGVVAHELKFIRQSDHFVVTFVSKSIEPINWTAPMTVNPGCPSLLQTHPPDR
jgi:hypothetical protein